MEQMSFGRVPVLTFIHPALRTSPATDTLIVSGEEFRRMASSLAVIGAPSSAGAYAPGQEKAPSAFRRHGLTSALENAGISVRDYGDIPHFRWRPDWARPKAMNLHIVQRTAAALAAQVSTALDNHDAILVLGGDCTIELGTVAGAQRNGASVGLIYIDLDVDLNSPEQSDGALDWTGVAHLLNLPGTASELSRLGARAPMLTRDDLMFFGADAITPSESEVINDLNLPCVRLAEVKNNPTEAAVRAVNWAARFDRLLIHLDVDVLAYTAFPIAENVRRQDGLTLDELTRALVTLLAAPNWRALTITEVNPDHAPDERDTFRTLIAAICHAVEGFAPGATAPRQ
jgi:arginase